MLCLGQNVMHCSDTKECIHIIDPCLLDSKFNARSGSSAYVRLKLLIDENDAEIIILYFASSNFSTKTTAVFSEKKVRK